MPEPDTCEAARIRGDTLTAISDGMVALLKEFHGHGPTGAKSYYQDDLVVCILRGGFSRVEESLIAGGRGHAVMPQRIEFQDLMRERFEQDDRQRYRPQRHVLHVRQPTRSCPHLRRLRPRAEHAQRPRIVANRGAVEIGWSPPSPDNRRLALLDLSPIEAVRQRAHLRHLFVCSAAEGTAMGSPPPTGGRGQHRLTSVVLLIDPERCAPGWSDVRLADTSSACRVRDTRGASAITVSASTLDPGHQRASGGQPALGLAAICMPGGSRAVPGRGQPCPAPARRCSTAQATLRLHASRTAH